MQQRVGGASSRRRWLVTGLALVGTVGVGATLLFRGQTTAGEAPLAPPIPVVVREVDLLERPVSFGVSGEVEARSTVNLGFKIPGVMARVLVDEGDAVRAGQLLAELDATDYRLNLELAAAQADLAQDAHRRASQLHAEGGLADADFIQAEVALRQANAQHALARNQVEDTRLVSPISGVLARRGIHPGEQAGPGMPLFTVVAIDPAQVRVGVPEAEIAQVRVGQTATVRLPALPGTAVEGRVEVVGVLADPVSRTYSVKIGVSNPAGTLRPGMIAEASIRDDAQYQVVTIPGEAVVPDHDGATLVYVYDPQDQRVYSRRVRVGTVFGQEVQVLSGLEAGELVVVGGQHRVRDGSRVEVTTPDAGVGMGAP